MEKIDYKIIKKQPEKIENRLEKEKKFISDTVDKARKKSAEPDFLKLFSDLLVKLKNPIQIWIRATVFANLGLHDISKLYFDRASEMGYPESLKEAVTPDGEIVANKVPNTTWTAGKVHTYKSDAGYTCLHALDAETSKKMDDFLLNGFTPENIKEGKEVFLMDPGTITPFPNIYADIDTKLKAPEYDSVALSYLIDGDSFLKFMYYQLASGDQSKDLEMMYNSYVKGEEHLIKRMRQYESILIKENSDAIVKNNTTSALKNLLGQMKIEFDPNKIQKGEVDNIIYKMGLAIEDRTKILEGSYDLLTPDARVGINNDLYGFDLFDLTQILLKTFTSYQNQSQDVVEKLKKMSGWSTPTCQWMVKCFEQAVNIVLPYAWIGGKEATLMTSGVTSILSKSII